MSTETSTPRSRRALLTAGLVAGVATVASALGRPAAVRAGTDGDVVLGASNATTTTTTITTGSANTLELVGIYGNALLASVGSVGMIAVNGHSANGVGVLGRSNNAIAPGAAGWSGGDGTGLIGYSNDAYFSGWGSLPAAPAKTGVYGLATQDSSSRGVFGKTTTGRGVFGQATSGLGVRGYASSGTGGSFEATTGVALRAVGRVKLDNCAGVATIASGTNSKTVTPGIDLTSSSAVVATLNGNAGGSTTVKRVSVNATANTFTIYLTANATANVKVAWHVFG